jgi:ABC-type nitrate/sulfonate/bicarbonate transport system ATPase subunit
MDEPFSGLDPLMVDQATKLILQVSTMNEYNTIVVVTHSISSALVVADTVLVMGRDYVEGKPVPGAYIKHSFNLIERGLAWRPDIRKLPEFHELEAELRDLFNEL